MTKELVFFTQPQSRGRIVRWMLEEVGAPYTTELVEFGPPMKTADYLAINPMGKIPAIRHGDAVVTESAAICAYLADAFPEAGLAPPPADRAAYYRWLFFAAGPVESAVTNTAFGIDIPEDRQGMSGYSTLALTLNALETAVANTDYITGDTFSAADVYVGSQVTWGMHFGIIDDRAAFKAYSARVMDREACRRVEEIDGPLNL